MILATTTLTLIAPFPDGGATWFFFYYRSEHADGKTPRTRGDLRVFNDVSHRDLPDATLWHAPKRREKWIRSSLIAARPWVGARVRTCGHAVH